MHKSREDIGIANDESGESVRRYVRLTYLIPELLQLVDDIVKYGKNQILTMGIKPVVEISYLTKEEQITMIYISKFQNSTIETANSKKLKDYINKRAYGSKSKDALVSILSASDNTYKSITAVFGQKMNIFDDINVANVTCTSDFKFNVLGSELVALYVIVPNEDKTYFTLVTIIVGLLYRDLVKLANSNDNKELPYEIDFILDEFANCPPLADIEAIVSVARSREIHFHFFIQSFSPIR